MAYEWLNWYGQYLNRWDFLVLEVNDHYAYQADLIDKAMGFGRIRFNRPARYTLEH